MSVSSRLDRAFVNAVALPLSDDSSYVLFSDCHRGNGTSNDNFLKNQNLYSAALDYYYDRNFGYIELGDGDELWENHSMEQIKSIHSNTFWMLSRYYQRGQLHMLFGNHDMVKKEPLYTEQNFDTFLCSTQQVCSLFPGVTFAEGLILKDTHHKKDIYLTHGHQADVFNSSLWKCSRFLVRYIWQPLEHIGFLDPTSAAKNNVKKDDTEKRLTLWAERSNVILVAGHTHRPMIGTKESPYFNTGSCVHPRCITCIEVTHRCITLVKWTLRTRSDMSLYVAREELAGPVCIDDY